MLAYVFWHWPQASVDAEVYRTHLLGFHQTLANNKPPGFHYSTVFQIPGPAWLNTTNTAFEDWYLTEDSCALDPLNDGAVSGACEQPHNLVAREAEGGTAGLYRLRLGTPDFASTRFATWLSKPSTVSYPNFYESMQSIINGGAALWGRQMTLGPTTEFCLLSPKPIQLSDGVVGEQINVENIWCGQ